MIQIGNTIVHKRADGSMGFYWLCDIRPDGYVFFDWYGNPRRAVSTDFWKVSEDWLKQNLAEGTVEVFDSLPLEKYGDVFEQQAVERRSR